MKTTSMCLAIAIALLATTSVSAQEQQTTAESTLTTKFGIKGGLNLSNLYVDDIKDENLKLGLNAGFFAKVPITRGFSIQPELLFSSKGAKLTYDNILQGKGEYRYNLNYVELPVLAVVNIAKNLNLHVGGYAAYLANVNIKDVDDNGTVQGIEDFDEDDFNRFDYGLAGGLGLDIANFTTGVRYNYGLNEIGKSGTLAGRLTKDSKNSALTFYIGFGF